MKTTTFRRLTEALAYLPEACLFSLHPIEPARPIQLSARPGTNEHPNDVAPLGSNSVTERRRKAGPRRVKPKSAGASRATPDDELPTLQTPTSLTRQSQLYAAVQ